MQTVVQTGPQSALRLTTARYYTPSGRSVQAGGIDPDIVVPQLIGPGLQETARGCAKPTCAGTCCSQAKVEDEVLETDDIAGSALPDDRRRAREEGRQGLPARLCAEDAEAARCRSARCSTGGLKKSR